MEDDRGEARAVATHETDITGYAWSPDGGRVAFTARDAVPQARRDLEKKGFNQEIFEEQVPFVRVFVDDTRDAAPARRLDLDGSASTLAWSPAGDRLAVALAPTPFVDDDLMRRRVHIVDVASGRSVDLGNPGKLGPFAWSRDGRFLAMVSGEDLHDPAAGRLLVAPAEGGGGTFTFTAAEDAEPTEEAVAGVLAEAGLRGPEVAIDGREVTVTVEELPASPLQQVADALAGYAGVSSASVSVSTVGPTWGETVTRKAAQAMVIFFVLLAIYLSFRFEWKMAAAAILAVLHDIVVTAGLYALFQFEVTPATVTAFLTILGFSLYDTVVVFDKVAENERTLTATGRSTYGEMVNRSLNAVLMRSLSTTLVALLPVVSLLVVGSLIMGATALEEFAIALAAGLFIGSYSSLFVAAPLLAWWKGREPQY
ncbi:MAG: protein translocase subunit SecF, partial [Candidatus Rokubacteria bacterium]|nr:protein translocase subunit SecF [Candidatus Rokubacteria bacterium]